MSLTSVPNNPAINLLAYYPSLTTQLNALYQQCDPTNGNYFVATGRDLVTFIALPSTSAPAYNAGNVYAVGQVVNDGGIAYIAIAGVPASTPPPNGAYWALYTGSTITVFSAPDACTGRTANIIDYPVTVFDATTTAVEFLVLPSSVFTQASGNVNFQASSNLVYVYVRSL
jgi:hypothetical protein